MDKLSYLSNSEVSAVENLYQQYKNNPQSVDFGWQKFFEGFEFSKQDYASSSGAVPENFLKEFKVINLINAYRTRGHLFTETNPVRARRKYSPTLDIENFDLTTDDLEKEFAAGSELGIGTAKLKDIVSHLKQTYTRSIGAEYMFIRDPEKIQWFKDKLEKNKNTPNFSKAEKKQIMHKINQAVVFENFMHKKFVGQKRFSLEGGETLIPALEAVVEKGAQLGIKEFVMGMAHRGRLNVLANIFNKTYSSVFSEFEGKEYEDNLFDGDVKYHLGYSSTTKTNFGQDVHLTLSPNPSHLEAVDPIVEGIVRAKIDQYLNDENKICPILIHGDASIAGQGLVYEVIQMAGLPGYRTGGTIHIVINNQIGFTTNYLDGRTSTYCTDIGKVTKSPIFHVNGDDAEAVTHVTQLAMEYRQRFHTDVFIDLLCYRKYGHNEGDEPRFTQPILYKLIAKHPNPREIYLKKLLAEGVITQEEADKMEQEFNDMLQERLEESREIKKATITSFMQNTWAGLTPSKPADYHKSPETGVEKDSFLSIAKTLTHLPKNKKFFKKIEKLFDDRRKMIEENQQVDWAMAELLAYGSLLKECYNVRLSGQDVKRGTFSHRHAVITIEDSEEEYIPLNNIGKMQGQFFIYNSLLSEYGVLGFDYGYAMAAPNSLVIWEAQFGDFNNGAQIIIDQFLSAAQDKWNVMNGLVMLLPHGYEGQGAEHSSARMERFLQLCSEENIQVANCTTPANFFHVLRRQLKRNFRTPLVVFTPKSLLRHPRVVSPINNLIKGAFQEIIDDEKADPKKIKRLVFCSGKVFIDAIEKREELGVTDMALVRFEQLYPFPENQFNAILKKYDKAEKLIWLQEEPENMGPWTYILRLKRQLPWILVSRHESASPATGSSKRHQQRFEKLMNTLFNA